MNIGVTTSSDPVIRGLLERRELLRVELQRLESFMSTYEDYAGKLLSPSPAVEEKEVSLPSAPAADKLDRERFIAVVQGVLSGSDRPMSCMDLLRGFRECEPDYAIEAHNFRRRLRTMCTRREHVQFITGHGYWPVDRPWHEAGSPREAPVARGRRARTGARKESSEDGTMALLPFVVMPVRGPLDHYGVLADTCGCVYCVEWRVRRDEVNRMPRPPQGHIYMSCSCLDCVRLRQAHLRFQEVENRRNLWCEMSFHVVHNQDFLVPGHRKRCDCPRCDASRLAAMARIGRELADPGRNSRWWVEEGNNYPMSYWFRRALDGIREATVSMVGLLTSGAVAVAA